MKPVRTSATGDDQEWDSFGIFRSGFQTHWKGDLVNLFTVVSPLDSLQETERKMKDCVRSIAAWVCSNRDQFEDADQFQIIIGWPKSVRNFERQTIRAGGSFDELASLADGSTEIWMKRGWSRGVFIHAPQESC